MRSFCENKVVVIRAHFPGGKFDLLQQLYLVTASFCLDWVVGWTETRAQKNRRLPSVVSPARPAQLIARFGRSQPSCPDSQASLSENHYSAILRCWLVWCVDRD